MIRKIFLYAFALGALITVLCTMIFFAMQYSQTMNETYAALQGEASYAASGLEIGGLGYLQSLDNTNRITWIDGDGEVLYDSEYPSVLNQAKDREVRQALETGSGQGVRKSASGGKRTMYYAFRCEDGTVLRLSRPLSAVRNAFLVVSPVLWVFLLVLMVSAATAFRIARGIADPINSMELEDLPHAAPYPELQPLVARLQEQREIIARHAVEQEQMRREAAEMQAREQERLRREFSANVSHELKTPLTSISGFAEIMKGGLCDEEKMIEFAGDIYGESQRLIALVNDIIRISELDEGESIAVSGEVDLLQTAREVIRILEPAAKKRGIDLEICNDVRGEQESGICILGTSRLIEEMVYNLCDNAVKYNRENGRVLIRVWEEEDQACISVEDTGIGIPAGEQERVFERFYRVDKSHSRKIGGTGLGLSIVKHVAQLHGASLRMESQPGRGTTITVLFPAADIFEGARP